MPEFTTFTEGAHSAEFILSEANGQRSRANALLVDPISVKVGQPLKKTAATSDVAEHWTAAVLGADCDGLAIYAATTSSGYDKNIAVLVRDAEVNGALIQWPVGMLQGEKTAGLARFATNGIITHKVAT